MTEHKLRVKITGGANEADAEAIKGALENLLRKSGYEISGQIEIWKVNK